MSKVVLITDTHFGVRSNNDKFLNNMELFYKEIFFPYLDSNQWDVIIHLGDMFHDRRKIDTFTIKRTREMFTQPIFDRLTSNNKQMYIICGNHDLYYRDKMEPNNLQEFLEYQDFGNQHLTIKPFNIVTQPTESSYGLLIPWINKFNKQDIMNAINQSNSDYLYGHLELQGFNFSKSQISMHGDDPKGFKKFKKTLTGHYHYKHNKDNIYYLGSPSEQTRIDTGTKHGFHILDTDNDKLTFIENPYNIFQDVNIDEVDNVKNNHPVFYRLYFDRDSTSKTELDKAIEKLNKLNAYDVETISINKSKDVKILNENNPTLDNIEDTPTFIQNYVKDPELSNILILLYNKAIDLQ